MGGKRKEEERRNERRGWGEGGKGKFFGPLP